MFEDSETVDIGACVFVHILHFEEFGSPSDFFAVHAEQGEMIKLKLNTHSFQLLVVTYGHIQIAFRMSEYWEIAFCLDTK